MTTTDRIAELEAQIADLIEHGAEVMRYLEKHGPSIVPHLLDTDDNPGERFRRAIVAAEQAQ